MFQKHFNLIGLHYKYSVSIGVLKYLHFSQITFDQIPFCLIS